MAINGSKRHYTQLRCPQEKLFILQKRVRYFLQFISHSSIYELVVTPHCFDHKTRFPGPRILSTKKDRQKWETIYMYQVPHDDQKPGS